MEKSLFKITIERSNQLESYDAIKYVVAKNYSVVGKEYPNADKIEKIDNKVIIL